MIPEHRKTPWEANGETGLEPNIVLDTLEIIKELGVRSLDSVRPYSCSLEALVSCVVQGKFIKIPISHFKRIE